MILKELQPTPENLYETFIKDSIGRDESVVLFVEYINRIDSSFSLAVDSSWGGGKTFFVKQAKMVLDAFNPHIENPLPKDKNETIKTVARGFAHNKDEDMGIEPQVSVYYDAWENDSDPDPVLSLVYEIIRSINVDYSFKDNLNIFKLSTQIVDFLTGKNTSEILDKLRGDNPLDVITQQKNLHDLISSFLSEVLKERGNRLVLFIDELDRCKPSYAIQLLEKIKHYFANDQITFIFSVNSLALQHTICSFYGEKYDSVRYLDRFFDLTMALPPVNVDRFYTFYGIHEGNTLLDSVRFYLVKHYHLSMREILRYYRVTAIAANNAERQDRGLSLSLTLILPVAVVLRLTNFDDYLNFIQGRNGTPFFQMMDANDYFYAFGGLIEVNSDATSKNQKEFFQETAREIYSALLTEKYDSYNFIHKIGYLSFTEDTRMRFLSLLGILSRTADYDQ